MNKRHLRRSQKELPEFEDRPGTGQPNRGAYRGTQIFLPSFAAKFTPPDFQRLLPAKILRLLVREQFPRERVRLDDSQFCQTITSFSSSTP
jgi:hypothetical protein